MNEELRWKVFFTIISIGNLVSGMWMLISPVHWYQNFPGRIPDFGPLNEHFVRDLGCIFVLLSIISFKSVLNKEWRSFTLSVLQVWFSFHALVHLFDTFRGLVAYEHLYMDIPLCYLPPILILVMQLIYVKEQNNMRNSN